MKKGLCIIIALTSWVFLHTQEIEYNPPFITNDLGRFETIIRGVIDFFWLENTAFHGISTENESLIKDVIHELDMDNHCIELRSLSSLGKLFLAHLSPAITLPMPLALFNRKYHTFLFIDEEYFSLLSEDEKKIFNISRANAYKMLSRTKKIFFYIAISFLVQKCKIAHWKTIQCKAII